MLVKVGNLITGVVSMLLCRLSRGYFLPGPGEKEQDLGWPK
jgi:hypothetical protein